jgi:hypothetical protein
MRVEVRHIAKFFSLVTVVAQEISAVIRNATHEDLVGARNDAYMQLYTANFKLNGNLESLEYVFIYFLIRHQFHDAFP